MGDESDIELTGNELYQTVQKDRIFNLKTVDSSVRMSDQFIFAFIF